MTCKFHNHLDAGASVLTNVSSWAPPIMPGFMRATQVSKNNENINDPLFYGAGSNTIIVPNTGDVVWLVIDTVTGDHPSEFKTNVQYV